MMRMRYINIAGRWDSAQGNASRGSFYSAGSALLVSICVVAALLLFQTPPVNAQNLTFEDIKNLPASPPDRRIAYGADPSQFGDLRLPKGRGRHAVVIVIHGGCWYSEYDLTHIASLCEALTRMGVATWSLEYRRIGASGGGWPRTFDDVAQGTDFLRVLARTYPLDLSRVIVIGHSAGGQLALWLAARGKLPKDSALYSADPLPLKGVVSLAGITDLRKYRPNCGDAVTKLLGGPPEEVPLRYQQTSPLELLPLRIKQRLIHGRADKIVPIDQSNNYIIAARQGGDDVELVTLESVGHFDLIATQPPAWPAVQEAVRSLLRSARAKSHRKSL